MPACGKAGLSGLRRNLVNNFNIIYTLPIYINLRGIFSQNIVADSSDSFFNSAGEGLYSFENSIVQEFFYWIQLKHRNSIETWSSLPVQIIGYELSYDFRTDDSKAFGNNLIPVDLAPLRFAIYSGDVNQDDVVDASDLGFIDNDASNFVTGYVNTDLTGDDVVDASDAAIADNNAANFIIAITP